ncbi:MAG: hypothetical protein WC466_06855 [Candidatus Izemoplasmatales bacterium]
MSNIRKIIKEQIETLIQEGRFDKFVGDIVRDIWMCVMDSKHSRKKTETYSFKYKEPLVFNSFVQITREKNDETAYAVKGMKIVSKKILVFLVLITSPDRKKEQEVYNDVYMQLQSVVRHELEHLVQQKGTNNIKGRVSPISHKERLEKEGTYLNFVSKDELPAYVAGIYRRAKMERKPFDEVAKEYLSQYISNENVVVDLTDDEDDFNISDAEGEIVLNTWIEYARKNYPSVWISTD